MKMSYKVSTLSKISPHLLRGKFYLTVPKGFAAPLGGFLRNLLLSDVPAFGLQSIVSNTSEFTREKNLPVDLYKFIENLKKVRFSPTLFLKDIHNTHVHTKTYFHSLYFLFPKNGDSENWRNDNGLNREIYVSRFNFTNKYCHYPFCQPLSKLFISQKTSSQRQNVLKKIQRNQVFIFERSENLFAPEQLIQRSKTYRIEALHFFNLFHRENIKMSMSPTWSSDFQGNWYSPKDLSRTIRKTRYLHMFERYQNYILENINILTYQRNNFSFYQKVFNNYFYPKFTQKDVLFEPPIDSVRSVDKEDMLFKKSKRQPLFDAATLEIKKLFQKKTEFFGFLPKNNNENYIFPFLFGCCKIFPDKKFYAKDILLPTSIQVVNPTQLLIAPTPVGMKQNVWNLWLQLGFEPALTSLNPLQNLFLPTFTKKDLMLAQKSLNDNNWSFHDKLFSQKTNYFLKPLKQQVLRHSSTFVQNSVYRDISNSFFCEWKILFTFNKKKKLNVSKNKFNPDIRTDKFSLYEIDCRPAEAPIRKVHFFVKQLNFQNDLLCFEIYTNGSLSPLFAFEYARQKGLAILRFFQKKNL